MGGGAFKPRALDIEGAEDFDNVHYHVSNIQQYEGQASDRPWWWGLCCGRGLLLLTRLLQLQSFTSDNFRALEHSVEELKQSSVSIKTPFVPSRLIGEKWSCHSS